ncbi:MAG: cache domain-containing protein [Candidatus Aminicenantes bacterium]|nr:cache domain-containing protein [Candidatus Aminicenantes bacterium]
MPGQRSLAKLFFYSSIIVISVLTVLICLVLIINKYRSFYADSNKIEETFYREQLDVIKSKVNEIIEYIDYNKSQAEEVLKEDIKRRVHEAYLIALNIYGNNKTSKSKNEIKKIIKDALLPIRFNKGRGYYFIDDLDSNIILYPPERQLEGKPTPTKDSIKVFIDLVKAKKEGFTYYHWYKPDQKEIMNKKITYLKLFEPYRWIIGTGEYLDEVEKDIQENVIKRIKATRFGKDEKYYIFMTAILDKKGGAKFARIIVNSKYPNLVGRYIPDTFKDAKNKPFFGKIVQECLKKGDAVTSYWDRNPGGEPLEKIAYSRLYKGWDWVVSSGFYPADLQAIISQNKTKLRNTVGYEVMLIIATFLAILMLAILVANYFSKKIKKEFDIFANFFKESAKKNEFLEKERLKVTEFRDLADSANKMIGDKKAGEDALLKAKELAEAATRLKSEFLANISHEIRTPMNAIIGMSEILAQTELKENQQEYLEIINNSAINLLAILNDILDVSKMEAGRIVLEKKNFKVHEIIEGTADMIAMEAYDKKLEVITAIDPNIPAELNGDPARLQQILLNLVNNALKFTEAGEIFISTEIAKEKKNDIKLLFKVKDTGIGISPAGKGRLFKIFSQIDGSLTRKYEGAGLGLALSKRLTELMKGEIGVDSQEGKGSTFWFTAIFKKIAAAEIREQPPAAPPALKEMRALIVDDNETVRSVLRAYLEPWGIYCEEAGNALEAFSKLQSKAGSRSAFSTALIDSNMPEISGDQIATMIRDSAEIKDIKLVLLAAPNYKIDEGFDDILHKPLKRSQLLHCLANVTKPSTGQGRRRIGPSMEFIERMIKMMDKCLDILLVEDNYFNQKVIIYNLEKFGHRVEIAENGKIAIDKYKKKKYDLILMDVQMPVMDGYEATRLIRLLEKEHKKTTGQEIHIPIVAMTAHTAAEDVARSLKSGMDAHLTKPFNLEKFVKTINDIIENAQSGADA